jgi:alpha-N-arabinofuranosidase
LTALLATLVPLTHTSFARAAATESAWVQFDSFSYQGGDPVFDAVPPGVGEFYNPVVAGFYPDPSICRVGDDFYLIHSSFSFFPGIPIFHSRDLVNWTQLGHVLDRPSQLNLDGLSVSSGIYAPAIEHHDGLFYVITTNVYGIGNFYVTAKDPAGPWSDPITLPFDGIDPSFFFDDDGRAYVVHNGPPPEKSPLYEGHRAIWLWEFDPAARSVKNGRIIVDGGSDIRKKPVWVEGPHIYKRGGWYYLSCAEGGTGPDHSQVVFRTRKLSDPFVPAPHNPILTQRDLDADRADPVTALGHADLVETASGEWWAVFLGIRPYEQGKSNIGRETFLLPVTWTNDWPDILEKGRVLPRTHPLPALPASPRPTPPTTGSFAWRDDFDAPRLGLPWLFLRTPRELWWTLSVRPGSLLVEPRPVGLDSVDRKNPKLNANPSFVARRLQHVDFQAETAIEIQTDTLASDAGLAALQNDTNYLFLGVRIREGHAREVFLERRDKSVAAAGIVARHDLPASARRLELRVSGTGRLVTAAYRLGEEAAWQVLAADLDGSLLSTQDAGGFVGAVVGLYARLPVQAAASAPNEPPRP